MAPSQNQRAANACENCRKRKVKCSGEHPCGSCRRHKWQCSFGSGHRSRYSESYVQHLLSKIRTYEERTNADPDSHLDESEMAEDDENHQILHNISTSPATDCAPGRSFVKQAKSLLHAHHNQKTSPQNQVIDETVTNDLAAEYDADDGQPQDIMDLIENITPVPIPSQSDSILLMERFIYYLGVTQHFFDPRTFEDSITMLFRNSASREIQKKSLWYTQYLLVMAMGMLIKSDDDRDIERPPGVEYFAEAMRRLPSVYKLRNHGVLAVEILLIATLYLSWCDRTHEAYFYVGVTLRLAIALGCSKPWKEQICLPSEASHRVRLWWTVYMLDRRLSASLGLPVGSDDRQMVIEMPPNSAGFQSPIPLIMNVRIARATGEIMSSLYGDTEIKQVEVIQKIQHVLHSLYETGRAFPPEHMINFTRPLISVSRTAASLHLMLFQAIILCVRPIILQRVRITVSTVRQEGISVSTQEMVPAVARLCQTGNEAAVKSLLILSKLQQQEMIPRFGYFDLDATFSAAFIIVMIGAIDTSSNGGPPTEIGHACELLRYLAQAGNKAAARRLEDIRQFCTHVWSLDPNPSPEAMNTSKDVIPAAQPGQPPFSSRSGFHPQTTGDNIQAVTAASSPGHSDVDQGRSHNRREQNAVDRDYSNHPKNMYRNQGSSPETTAARQPKSRKRDVHQPQQVRLGSESEMMNVHQERPFQSQSQPIQKTDAPCSRSTNDVGDSLQHPHNELDAGDTNTFFGFDQLIGNQTLDFDFGPEDMSGIYSSFNDPDLHLTGVDYADWLEMEKLFALGSSRDPNNGAGS